jgi:hypothetical protein
MVDAVSADVSAVNSSVATDIDVGTPAAPPKIAVPPGIVEFFAVPPLPLAVAIEGNVDHDVPSYLETEPTRPGDKVGDHPITCIASV